MRRLVQTSGRGKQLKGGALFIAIVVSVIVAIILLMFIMIAQFGQLSVSQLNQNTQLRLNLRSAFEIVQSKYFTAEQNNRWFKNNVNNDSIKITKLNWGAYNVVVCRTKNNHHILSQAGVFGTFMSADTGLMVADNGRQVGMSGNIVLKANCFLPSGGIKPAFIEGQSYQGSSQNSIFIKKAQASIPMPRSEFIDAVTKQFDESVWTDSITSAIPPALNQPFTSKTVVLNSTTLKLQNVKIQNNVKIKCANELEIDSTCVLENILIICKKVKFKKGFKGTVHVIATDSIVVDKRCHFKYPSSFTLLNSVDANTNLKTINFDADCKFYGGLLAINNPGKSNASKVLVKLNQSSEINGFVYSSDYMHVEGVLNATLISGSLLLKTPSAVYENHLLGCEINPRKHASILAIPSIFTNQSKLVCCKKINI